MSLGILCEEGFAHSFMAQVASVETKADLKEFIARNEGKNAAYIAAPAQNSGEVYRDDEDESVPENSVFVMGLNGPVFPESEFGIPGLDQLTDQISWAVAEPNIAAIVFRLETGGGSTYKLWQFCDFLLEQREIKPILFHITGMSCSAGVAIHTCGSGVTADHSSVRVGSIGVCMSYIDMYGWMEKQGCKYTYVNAPTNPDKNKEFTEMRAGNVKPMEEHLAEIHVEFKDRVRSQRPKIDDTSMTGKVYTALQAADNDIIDGVGTLEQVISYARDLGQNINMQKSIV